jgi:PAS domain S-box-containing protein
MASPLTPQNSDLKLIYIFGRMTDAFVALDAKWVFTYVNPKAAEIFGRKPEDLIGKHIWTEFPEGIVSTFNKVYSQAMAEQRFIQIEEYYPPWDRWFENRIHPSPDGLSIFLNDITERKKNEHDLITAKEFSENLIRAASMMIVMMDRTGKITRLNKAGEKITGYTEAEVKGKNWFEVLAPKDRYPFFWEEFNRLTAGAVPKTFENPILPRSGEERCILWHYNEIRKGEEFVGLIFFGSDITDRKLTEKLLADREEQLRTIIATEPDCVTLVSKEGRILQINPAGLAMIEADSIDQVKGESIFPVVDPAYQTLFKTFTENVFRGESGQLQFAIRGIKGGCRWVETHAVPLRNAKGEIISYLGLTRDITKHKLAEEALIEKQHLLSESQRIAHIGSWFWDLATNKILWSEETYRLYGVSPLNFVLDPDSFLNLIHPDDRAAMSAWISDCIAGKGPGELVFRAVLPTGEVRALSRRGVLQRDTTNRPVSMVGTLQDITERKQTEEALQTAHDELEGKVEERTKELSEANLKLKELDRLKSEFLATMSHELRTPLNSIIGFLGIALQGIPGPLNDEQRKQLSMAHGSAKHLLGLINDILDLSRIESGRVDTQFNFFKIETVVSEVIHNLEPLASEKGLRLSTEIARDLPAVETDRKKIYQVLLNLVNNAVKFTHRGEIKIECKVQNHQLEIQVSDTGIGIKRENMDHLFEAFRQLDGSLTRRYQGTGLGLYLCKKLTNLLGGQVRAESEFGKGSRFTVILPVKHRSGVVP